MAEDIRTLLATHLPGYDVRSVETLGEGLDNVAHEVNAELVVRASKDPDPAARAAATRGEVATLALAGSLSPLPVPEVVFADEERGVVAYRKLPGAPLLTHPVAHPGALAAPLARFLTALHTAPAARTAGTLPIDDEPLSVWHAEATADAARVANSLPPPARAAVASFLAAPPPPDPDPASLAFCHADLGAEHVLVDPAAGTVTVTGVIDWTDAAVTDPARDLGLILRDHGPTFLALVVSTYRGRWDAALEARTTFHARCGLLADLAYGLATARPHYAKAALAHVPRLFTA